MALTHPSCVNSVVGISSSVQHKTLTQEDRYQLPAPHLPVPEVPQTGPKCHQPVYDPPSVPLTVPHHVTYDTINSSFDTAGRERETGNTLTGDS